MKGKIQALKTDIKAEMATIERLFAGLPQKNTEPADINQAIITGYYLHNLYNVFESIFRLVAETFENDIPDANRWHTLLLDRMSRDIEGIRPALIGPTAHTALDELRRFRHLFRHLYRDTLEPEGVQKALHQAHTLQTVYQADIERFMKFLDTLSHPSR